MNHWGVRFGLHALLMAACAATMAAAVRAETLDQQSPVGNTSFNGDAGTLNWQQELTVGVAGRLNRVEIYVNAVGNTDFYINVGAPWQVDPNDFETVVSAQQVGWISVDVSSANISLDVGDKFVIGIKGRDENLWFAGSGFPGLYERGELYLNSNVYVGPGQFDIAFNTYMEEGGGCNGRETLKATCKRGTFKVSAKLKRGTPGSIYTFCLDRGDCRPAQANNGGKAKTTYRNVPQGPHVVGVTECNLQKDVDCS